MRTSASYRLQEIKFTDQLIQHNRGENVSLWWALVIWCTYKLVHDNHGEYAIGTENQIHVHPDWVRPQRECQPPMGSKNQIHVLANWVRQCQSPVGSKISNSRTTWFSTSTRSFQFLSDSNAFKLHTYSSYELGLQSSHHRIKSENKLCAPAKLCFTETLCSVLNPKIFAFCHPQTCTTSLSIAELVNIQALTFYKILGQAPWPLPIEY